MVTGFGPQDTPCIRSAAETLVYCDTGPCPRICVHSGLKADVATTYPLAANQGQSLKFAGADLKGKRKSQM